jgi:disulfide oxidoreductase YuzD
MPDRSKPISVSVIFDSRSKKCEAACGINWSAASTDSTIEQRVKERFGDTVLLTFIDLATPDSQSAGLAPRINRENLSVPLLIIDNEVRISGEFDARQLMDAIEAEKELKWTKTSM